MLCDNTEGLFIMVWIFYILFLIFLYAQQLLYAVIFLLTSSYRVR